MRLSPQAQFHLPPALPRLPFEVSALEHDAMRPPPPSDAPYLRSLPLVLFPFLPIFSLPSQELRESFKRAPGRHRDSQGTTKGAQERHKKPFKKPQELCPTKGPVGT